MRRNTIGIAAATLAAAGAIGVAGAAIASAADNNTVTPGPSATSSTAPGGNSAGGGASKDTAVTGSEAEKVIAAVKAKDSAVTITTVRKDPDGSYDAIGTKGGSPVFYDVSADLKTITAGGGRGGHGGPGGSPDDTGTLPGQSGATANTSSNPSDANGATAVRTRTTQ
ncbi:MAG TPA: hypothetical protein VFL10_07805 [Ornithinibacter sp.]|nr:hypothetical protein [Ornithinibacter sp.]